MQAFNYKVKSIRDKLRQPLCYGLTKRSLHFLRAMFDVPDKFSKYTFSDEIIVFYIRTHHVNFVRLYNKNKKYLESKESVKKHLN